MSSPFNDMIDIAREALSALVERNKEMLIDARGGPRMTKKQKDAELAEFMGLPQELRNIVMGRMVAQGIDPEKWLAERSK